MQGQYDTPCNQNDCLKFFHAFCMCDKHKITPNLKDCERKIICEKDKKNEQ